MIWFFVFCCTQRCEPFSTYPRTYDLIHVAGIESLIKHPGSGKSRYLLEHIMFIAKPTSTFCRVFGGQLSSTFNFFFGLSKSTGSFKLRFLFHSMHYLFHWNALLIVSLSFLSKKKKIVLLPFNFKCNFDLEVVRNFSLVTFNFSM